MIDHWQPKCATSGYTSSRNCAERPWPRTWSNLRDISLISVIFIISSDKPKNPYHIVGKMAALFLIHV